MPFQQKDGCCKSSTSPVTTTAEDQQRSRRGHHRLDETVSTFPVHRQLKILPPAILTQEVNGLRRKPRPRKQQLEKLISIYLKPKHAQHANHTSIKHCNANLQNLQRHKTHAMHMQDYAYIYIYMPSHAKPCSVTHVRIKLILIRNAVPMVLTRVL